MKSDPSRTKTLRGKFERELTRRFNKLQRAIKKILVDEDRFGLLNKRRPTVNAREWADLTDAQKMERFTEFLEQETGFHIVAEDDRFWEQYVQDGYEKGAGRAFTDVNKRKFATGDQAFMAGRKSQFVGTMLGAPESVDKIKFLASRTLSDLTGVTDVMRTQIKRHLMDGLVQGQNPNVIARSLRDQMGINLKRAKTIARTEVIRAHAEGQLDAMEQMGIEQVGVMVEWSTAGDTRVCPLCSDVNGIVLRIKEAHNLIPRHPNCRCAFVPANVGENKKGQKRGQKTIQKAIAKSKKRGNSNWGKGKRISKDRPKEIKN